MARSVVTYQVGLPLGCRRLARIVVTLRPFEPLEYPVFAEYGAATRELPVGTERLRWDRDTLRQKDVQLEAINRKFRDQVFEACYDILDRYAALSEKPHEIA